MFRKLIYLALRPQWNGLDDLSLFHIALASSFLFFFVLLLSDEIVSLYLNFIDLTMNACFRY
jgi:hypothetical protein